MVTTMDRFKGVKTISFDGDDTLWDFSSAMQTAMALVLQEIRHMVPTYATEQLTVPKMIEIREAVGKELGEGTVSLEQIRLVSLMRTLEYVGSPSEDMARQLYDLYMDSRLGNSRLIADVPENLAGIPQIKPTFLEIAPSGIPSNIIPHSKGVKCGLIRSNSPFSYSNHRPAKPKIPKPLVYAQVSPLGTSFATP